MATTTNFGWETPDDSDLVKDGAAAMRTLGNSIDSSMADLRGGTSGQVLSKNSNTDMDFTWVAQDDSNAIQNAIVDAKGDLIAASAADTPARLAVGTNEHRLVAASGETTGLKYVADTTNYAIAAKGDLLVGTAADTLQALSVGTNGYTLVADSSTSTGLAWAAAAGGGKVLQVVQDTLTSAESTTSASFVDTALSQAITPSSASSKVLIIAAFNGGMVRSSSDDANAIYNLVRTSTQIAEFILGEKNATGEVSAVRGYGGWVYLDSPNTTSATTYKIQFKADNATAYMAIDGRFSSLTLIEIGA